MTVTKCCMCARARDTIHTVLQSPHVGMAVVPALTNQETTGQRSRDRGEAAPHATIFLTIQTGFPVSLPGSFSFPPLHQ